MNKRWEVGGAKWNLIGSSGRLVCPLLPGLLPRPPPLQFPRVPESTLVSGAAEAGVGPQNIERVSHRILIPPHFKAIETEAQGCTQCSEPV